MNQEDKGLAGVFMDAGRSLEYETASAGIRWSSGKLPMRLSKRLRATRRVAPASSYPRLASRRYFGSRRRKPRLHRRDAGATGLIATGK